MKTQKEFLSHIPWRTISIGIFVSLVLLLSLRGILGSPSSAELNESRWKDEGPLELSPDRGRFALTYSLIEDGSFTFSNELARFAAPDVAISNGVYSSLFAPTLSYVIIPGYLIGRLLGASQVGAFAVVAIFAILNFFLIRAIARRLGAKEQAATIGALLFVFATPAFAYAVSLYQHHLSTFLILSSIYLFVRTKNTWSLLVIWALCGISISIDNPNLFLMFPIGVFALTRLLSVTIRKSVLDLKIKPFGFLTMSIMILPIAFFLYFNQMSYGNPFQLGGTLTAAPVVEEAGIDIASLENLKQSQKKSPLEEETGRSAVGFFQTRALPAGFYEYFISLDRGILMYSPVILIGFLGMMAIAKVHLPIARLLIAIVGVNILLYSMWGDPYGGWAFGSRYLIPTYALLAIGIGVWLSTVKRRLFAFILVFGLASYSIGVNTIGALTSSRNPPYVQILDLESRSRRQERYTYTRNFEILDKNVSKSFVYQTFASSYLTAWQYTALIAFTLLSSVSLSLISLYRRPTV